ncbi:MAG: WcaI family glycosyltransferase [Paracoccaceae bacterium]
MKILIHGLNHAPERIGTAVYTTRLAEFLKAQGHIVNVVTAHPYYPEWQRRPGWPLLGYRIQPADQSSPTVVHCPLFVPQKPHFTTRLLQYLSFLLTSLPIMLWLCIRRRPDIVISIAPSLVSSVVALICGRLIGAKIILHVQDFEVEAAFATKAIHRQSFIGHLALGFESFVLRRFDIVSSISAPMLRKLVEKGVDPDRVIEFRNWADLSTIRPLNTVSPMRAENGLTARHVVLYSGNIAEKQGLEIIPASARRLAHRTDVQFVICGNGAQREKLENACEGLKNVSFLPLQPFSRLNDLLGMADIHLLPQISGVEELVLPSKLANMLASGRPVITTASPNSALASEVNGCGVVVPPGDDAALAEAVEHLLEQSERRLDMGLAARLRAIDRWDDVSILSKFETQLFRSCRNEPFSLVYEDEKA